MNPFVSLTSVSFSYSSKAVLHSFTGCFCEGTVSGLLGPSGSGKSTLLRLIAGLERPSEGTIEFAVSDPFTTLVSQSPVIFEQYSRYENARYREKRGRHRVRFSEESFKDMSAILGLDRELLNDRRPYEPMSGGQAQRVALLRELSLRPNLILLDEPCSGLDAYIKRDFLLALRHAVENLEIRCIYATHHFDELRVISDDIVYLGGLPESAHSSARSVQEFAASPPTLDAAVAVLGPMASVVRVVVTGDTIEFGAADEGEGDVLVFSADVVDFTDSGIPYSLKSETSSVTIVSVGGQTIVAGARRPPRPLCLKLEGMSYRFSKNVFQEQITLKTEQLGDKCSVLLSRS